MIADTVALAIVEAVRRQVKDREEHLNRSTGLGQVTITIKFQAGTPRVRGVVWQEEQVSRVEGSCL